MAPTSTKQWRVEGQNGFDSLKFNEQGSIPEVGDKDVLVKSTAQEHSSILFKSTANASTVQGASLNYRDLIIPKGRYPFPMKDNVIPGSDGAGTVESVGKHVTRFKPGGTFTCPFLQDQILTIRRQSCYPFQSRSPCWIFERKNHCHGPRRRSRWYVASSILSGGPPKSLI